jgi:hypothetical protein
LEKTLEFAINEALESGRRSAMPQFLEMELREKIAQQIETRLIWNEAPIEIRSAMNKVAQRAADIARGTK